MHTRISLCVRVYLYVHVGFTCVIPFRDPVQVKTEDGHALISIT